MRFAVKIFSLVAGLLLALAASDGSAQMNSRTVAPNIGVGGKPMGSVMRQHQRVQPSPDAPQATKREDAQPKKQEEQPDAPDKASSDRDR